MEPKYVALLLGTVGPSVGEPSLKTSCVPLTFFFSQGFLFKHEVPVFNYTALARA